MSTSSLKRLKEIIDSGLDGMTRVVPKSSCNSRGYPEDSTEDGVDTGAWEVPPAKSPKDRIKARRTRERAFEKRVCIRNSCNVLAYRVYF